MNPVYVWMIILFAGIGTMIGFTAYSARRHERKTGQRKTARRAEWF